MTCNFYGRYFHILAIKMKFLFKYNTRKMLDIVHIVLFWLLIHEYLVHKIHLYFVHDPFITVYRDKLVNRGYRSYF